MSVDRRKFLTGLLSTAAVVGLPAPATKPGHVVSFWYKNSFDPEQAWRWVQQDYAEVEARALAYMWEHPNCRCVLTGRETARG